MEDRRSAVLTRMPRGGWRLLSLRHSGFNVHSLVRTETKSEAERVGKDMIRPVVSLERLEFIGPEGDAILDLGAGGPDSDASWRTGETPP